jgi:hypothetical protein
VHKRVYDLQAAVNVGLSAAIPTHATETRGFVTKAHEYNLFRQVLKKGSFCCLELGTGKIIGRSLRF